MRARLTLAACGAVLLLAPAPRVAAAAQQATKSNQLQVWNMNTHRMQTALNTAPSSTATDYRNFIGYITDSAHSLYYPDIVTLQEAGTDAKNVTTDPCTVFAGVLKSRTNQAYDCLQSNARGGAAIVFRKARLSRTGSGTPVPLDSVVSGGGCPSSSWRAELATLQDANGKKVNVAAIHLPTDSWTGPDGNPQDCAWDNMKIVNEKLAGFQSASMSVMAGDWNHADGTPKAGDNLTLDHWECWYVGVNVDSGQFCGGKNFAWKDPFYRACQGAGDAAAIFKCTQFFFPTRKSGSRIDFLFTKAYAISNQITVNWPDAAGYYNTWDYSDHRGQGALLTYY